ncbi:hypothetical protein O7632_05420 [Solwaraspora sp. WMMD406]|uniref:hypothetical protein n=1 Tax=Solwaraspora sp. WMMD406 TaxID=3016095 RepID=UPI002415B92B|nr:hypothetical protein [Solwaraspora sp. WMMD406]MDG4763551.1 hypothetical protein [Solwaraspora sp. WMMD406]
MAVSTSTGGAAGPTGTGPDHRPGGGADKVLRAVADGPLGPYSLLEAAFCWNERRPVGWRRLGPASTAPARQLPVAQIERPAAAVRMTRLLTTMTWAVGTPLGPASPVARVEVTAEGYHRVLRALAGAWRDGRRMLASPGVAAAHYPAALAVWRMAALLSPADHGAGMLTVSVSIPAAALLHSAAPALALPHSIVQRGGRSTVIRADRPTLFRRLLADLEAPLPTAPGPRTTPALVGSSTAVALAPGAHLRQQPALRLAVAGR